jgi:hypothetical protein
MPDIAWSQLNDPNVAISSTVLRCHEGINEKLPILVLRANACAQVPEAEMNNVATIIHTTLRPHLVSTIADARIAVREPMETRTVDP